MASRTPTPIPEPVRYTPDVARIQSAPAEQRALVAQQEHYSANYGLAVSICAKRFSEWSSDRESLVADAIAESWVIFRELGATRTRSGEFLPIRDRVAYAARMACRRVVQRAVEELKQRSAALEGAQSACREHYTPEEYREEQRVEDIIRQLPGELEYVARLAYQRRNQAEVAAGRGCSVITIKRRYADIRQHLLGVQLDGQWRDTLDRVRHRCDKSVGVTAAVDVRIDVAERMGCVVARALREA
jgi:hypothetical protein